jgi:nitrogen-specific signal transduction histidine kinase
VDIEKIKSEIEDGIILADNRIVCTKGSVTVFYFSDENYKYEIQDALDELKNRVLFTIYINNSFLQFRKLQEYIIVIHFEPEDKSKYINEYIEYKNRKYESLYKKFNNLSDVYKQSETQNSIYLEELKVTIDELSQKNRDLDEQIIKTREMLDINDNIVIISNTRHILEINRAFLKFFSEYKTLGDFRSKHKCICQFFEYVEDDNYIKNIDYGGKNWVEYVLDNPHIPHKVAIKRGDTTYHFLVTAKWFNDKERVAINFHDITSYVKLQEDKKQNEMILFQQSKLAMMGEMIGNIAHQWRQPLNVISSLSINLSLSNQLENLSNELLDETTTKIQKTVKHMSHTIDDFRHFFRPDKLKERCKISDIIESSLNIIESSFKSNEIILEIDNKSEIELNTYKNEIAQVLINILQNAKDVLIHKTGEKKVSIKSYDTEKYIFLSIEDNGGGIPKDIIGRVFEPYFTTKFQSQGTGIGLYMSKTIIESNLNGKIAVENTKDGAKFIIELPFS